LLDSDPDTGAVLLEGIEPGTQLAAAPGAIPLDEVADLLTQLHSVPGADGVPTVAGRVAAMFDLAERRWQGPEAEERLPRALLRRSRAAATALSADGPAQLVHGDLHPGNVLLGPAGIVAIDPRPCVGDGTFDAVDWAFLPLARGGSLDDGITALAGHLPDLDTGRLRRWCEALAVLVAMSPLRRDGPSPYTDALLRMVP
jgi:streptomycin 6-kinase